MSKGSIFLLAAIVAVGGIGLGYVVGSRDDSAAEVEDEGKEAEAGVKAAAAGEVERYKVPVTDAQPAKGPDDALITIVEFSEFQCPFCKRVLPTVNKVLDEYKGKVRIVWRNNPLPFHKDADPASQLAMEAFKQGGDDKFFEVHDLLFENQKALSRENLESYAEKAGLDMAAVKKALDEKTHAATIKADQTVASTFGARGTPNFFINGRNLRGAQPYDKFKAMIDEELKTAEAALKAGTKKSELYAAITKNGLTKAAPPKPRERPGQPDPKAVYKVPVQGDEPMKGSKDALVTIVEFSDFECPFCGRVEPTIDQVLSKYGDDVRVVWMNNPLPFHKNAMPAAIASLEAHRQKGDKGFWAMHKKMFENQRGLTQDNLEKWAKELGLNAKQFKAALDDKKFEDVIKKQQALAKSLGASGTPSFFVNGRNLRGAQPLTAFTALIDEELKKAKDMVAKGTSKSDLYAKIIAKGATAPQKAAAPAAPDADKVYNIAPPKDAPFKGSANAKIIIQEFSDFQCPFCGRVNPTVKQVLDEYGDKVKIVWRDYPLPFHKEAHPAAQAAREVYRQGGNDKFWAYHDILFQNQRALTRSDLEKYAQQVGGINMGKFKKALDSAEHKGAVDADMAAVQKAGARIGTPSFFINGKLLQGAQPFPAFKQAIDEALKGKS